MSGGNYDPLPFLYTGEREIGKIAQYRNQFHVYQ